MSAHLFDPDPAPLPIRRLRLGEKEFARQLGVPDELVRRYQREKFTHDLKRGEIRADLGFMSEELAVFIVLAHCQAVHGMPLDGTDRVAYTAVQRLCTTFPPESVFLVLRGEQPRIQGALLVGDRVTLEASEAPMHIFDLSILRRQCDEALEAGNLKFPRAQSCAVSIEDPRVSRTF